MRPISRSKRPFEEFDRQRTKPNLVGVKTPVSDVGLLLLSNKAPLLDRNVRLAVSHAIDKKTLIDKLLRGYGTPLDTCDDGGAVRDLADGGNGSACAAVAD